MEQRSTECIGIATNRPRKHQMHIFREELLAENVCNLRIFEVDYSI
jgi:hypothetical protein